MMIETAVILKIKASVTTYLQITLKKGEVTDSMLYVNSELISHRIYVIGDVNDVIEAMIEGLQHALKKSKDHNFKIFGNILLNRLKESKDSKELNVKLIIQ